jgi:predicted nucleotidyltransferase
LIEAREAAMDRERIAEEVARTTGVVFALLFGSRAEDRARADSDWDVGVYLDEALDAAARAAVRDRLIAALEPRTRIDVVVLNDAPALLARRALDGEPLLVRDRQCWVRFVVRTLAVVGDEAFWRDLHSRERERRLEEGSFGRS